MLLAPAPAAPPVAPTTTDRAAVSIEVDPTDAADAADADPLPDASAPAPAAPQTGHPPPPMPVPVAPPGNAGYGYPMTGDPPPVTRRARQQKKYPDRPIRWRADVGGYLGSVIDRHPSWLAFDDGKSAFNLGLNVRADFRLGNGRVFLGGGLAYQRSRNFGYAYYGTVSTSATIRDPLAFLRLSIAAVEGFDLFLQAGGGPSIVDLTVRATEAADQRSVAAVAEGLAGATIYLPKKWLPRRGASRVTAGLELAGGYTWHSPVRVQPDLRLPEDPIAGSSADFGDLQARGGTWRLGIFIRFQ